MNNQSDFPAIRVAVSLAFALALATAAQAADAPKEVTYIKAATSKQIKSMDEPGVKAYFEDLISTGDPNAPVTCALFKLFKSKPLKYDYTYDDIKLILEGEITIDDGKKKITARKGDVLLLPKGASITFTTASRGVAFACGQR